MAESRAATGADYALFTYVLDSDASGGRTALRAFGFIAGGRCADHLDPTDLKRLI